MSSIGLKGPYTSTVMTVLADQNSKKGQHEKAT
jgi:tetratricopeptide (TPR) repeat protein